MLNWFIVLHQRQVDNNEKITCWKQIPSYHLHCKTLNTRFLFDNCLLHQFLWTGKQTLVLKRWKKSWSRSLGLICIASLRAGQKMDCVMGHSVRNGVSWKRQCTPWTISFLLHALGIFIKEQYGNWAVSCFYLLSCILHVTCCFALHCLLMRTTLPVTVLQNLVRFP